MMDALKRIPRLEEFAVARHQAAGERHGNHPGLPCGFAPGAGPQLRKGHHQPEIRLIDEIIQEVLVNKEKKAALTDKADRLLTHNVLGLPIFLVIMAWCSFSPSPSATG